MKKISLIIISLIFFLSCTKHDNYINETIDSEFSENNQPPFASEEDLSQFIGDEDIIYYQIARAIAKANMEVNHRYKDLGINDSCILSNRPVIIYGFDNKPLEYDFIILNSDGQEMGTVSTPARRNSSVSVNEYRNTIDKYKETLAVSGMPNGRIYADRESNRYVGMPSPAGTSTQIAINTRSGENETELSYETDEDILARLTSPETLELLGEGVTVESLTAQYNNHKADVKLYHKAVDYIIDSIGYVPESFDMKNPEDNYILYSEPFKALETTIRIDDNSIPYTGGVTDFRFSNNSGGNNQSNEYIPDQNANIKHVQYYNDLAYISEYDIYAEQNKVGGWCGPWVVQAVIAVYNRTNYREDTKYLGEYSSNFWRWLSAQKAYPYTVNNMNDAFKGEANSKITVSKKHSNDCDVYWHIRQEGLPCYRLSIASDNEFPWVTWHWWLIYGLRRETRGWWIFKSTHYYHLVADNGAKETQGITDKGKQIKYYKKAKWYHTLHKVWY